MVEGKAYRGRLLLAHAVLCGFIALVMVPLFMVMMISFRKGNFATGGILHGVAFIALSSNTNVAYWITDPLAATSGLGNESATIYSTDASKICTMQVNVMTNTSAQVLTRINSSLGDVIRFTTMGWTDTRGK